jgi:hypothetical protein
VPFCATRRGYQKEGALKSVFRGMRRRMVRCVLTTGKSGPGHRLPSIGPEPSYRTRQEEHALPIVRNPFRPAIPRRVARQHCPPPLHRRRQHNTHSRKSWGKGDVSTLRERGHFYFALTRPKVGVDYYSTRAYNIWHHWSVQRSLGVLACAEEKNVCFCAYIFSPCPDSGAVLWCATAIWASGEDIPNGITHRSDLGLNGR